MSSTRKAKGGVPLPSETAPVIISLEEHRRVKMEKLAKRKNELRAQKIREIKAQIEEGTYRVDAADVAKSVIRGEIVRLLNGNRPNPDKRKES
jgi:flagellar biosynthesis anti-sigma factor FlgM